MKTGLLLSAFAIMISWPTCAGPLMNPLALTQIKLVSDVDAPDEPDDPGTGGSFDNSNYFQNKLADDAAIGACIDEIEASAISWAGTVGLTRGFRDRKPSSLTLHFSKPDLQGIFTLRYAVAERVQAKVRVDFYRLDGAPQAPEAARPLLNAYRIATFQDGLDKAILCKSVKP